MDPKAVRGAAAVDQGHRLRGRGRILRPRRRQESLKTFPGGKKTHSCLKLSSSIERREG